MIDATGGGGGGGLVLSPVVSSIEIKHIPLFRYERVNRQGGGQLRLYQMV